MVAPGFKFFMPEKKETIDKTSLLNNSVGHHILSPICDMEEQLL